MRKEMDDNNKRIIYKMEDKIERFDSMSTEISNLSNKINAFEELMSVQRSELFRAMSEFETSVLKKNENISRAFKQLSNDLNITNPLLGNTFY